MVFPLSEGRHIEVVDLDVGGPLDADIAATAASFIRTKDKISKLEAQTKQMRDTLLSFIGRYGVDPGDGNLMIELPRRVLGKKSLVRQVRRSRSFDSDKAESLLKSRGLWDRCTKTVVELDGDEIMACLAEGVLSEEDIEEIMPLKETIALVTRK